jgi:hypothetical protein
MNSAWPQLRGWLLIALWTLVLVLPAFGQVAAPSSAAAKVFVIPLKGPLHYRMAAVEISKIARSAAVQKPIALVLVVSCPGGDRQVAFEIARQIADTDTPDIIAFVSGDYGGAFGSGVLPLMTCRRVFVAPGNEIDLRPSVRDPANPTADTAPLAPREVSLLQAWTAQARRPWTPVQQWLGRAHLLAAAPSQSLATPGAADTRPASGEADILPSIPGTEPLRAEPAVDLKDVLRQIGAASAHVIVWPDPIERSNEAMQKTFRLADEMVKSANDAVAAAREADPRAQRYELLDVTRESVVGPIAPLPTTQPGTTYQVTERVVNHDQFSDGGAGWRAYTDRCMTLVREAISSNRRLVGLATRYPELGIDPKELNESHTALNAWLNQLRAERGLRSPPGTP